jgi:predicted nuclease of predicted toxin-antitoxin system
LKLLADQNVHSRVVLALRRAGYDVEFVQETMPGRADQEILARSDIGTLIFITGDKGSGRWIFDQGLPPPLAVLFSRLPHKEWAITAERLSAILERGVRPGQMITITKSGERPKPFAIGAEND